jgi:hypothetical protein
MMTTLHYLSHVITYFIGGLTMFPLFFFLLYLLKCINNTTLIRAKKEQQRNDKKQEGRFYKVGWLQVYQQSQRGGGIRGASLGGFVKSYLSKPPQNQQQQQTRLFAVLKFNTLYLYDSELQLDCKHVIHVTDYYVHIYPYGLKDYEFFSRPNEIQLRSKKIENYYYYINCGRCIDKEDWYFALLNASKWTPTEHPQNSTRFDQHAMNHLLSTVHSNASHFETQWLNALLGRLFLGIYKKESTRAFFFNKILSKINKLNARRPPFLDEITVRSVDGGHGAPYITEPRLLHLSPLGEYTAEFELYYEGHFRVEVETVLRWKYSDRLPALRIDLVLAITVQSIQGKMMMKIKEPPTNRAWLGFYEKPKIEWLIEPVMWEKRIGFAMVSKAIKTKLEEIMTETMVLPNMDDMVFSPAEGVGGIFGAEDDYGLAFLYKQSNVKKEQEPVTETTFEEEEDVDTNDDVDNQDVATNKQEKKKVKRSRKQEKEQGDEALNEQKDEQHQQETLLEEPSKKKGNEPFDTIPLYANVTDSLVTAEPMPLFALPNHQRKKKRWFHRKQTYTDEASSSLLLSTSSESDTPSQRSLKSVMNSKQHRQKASNEASPRLLQEYPSSSSPMQRLRSKSLPSTELTEISVEHITTPSNR